MIVIVPVVTAHVGCCVTLTVGATGVDGAEFTVTKAGDETHPALFFTVTV